MAAASGYDAFISYSHQHDRVLGPRLQSALQRFAKPWYRMRALRIFRDTGDLGASPALWASIEAALRESRWFVLLASPEAARSAWVNREVQWWLDHRSADRLIIVGTGAGLAWDERRSDWTAGAPVPPALRGAGGSEPLWVDLSDIPPGSHTARIPADRIATLAAPIRGMPKDRLVGEHLRQHRRVMQLAGGTIAFLLALAVGLAVVTVLAVRATRDADHQLGIAASRYLAIQSEALGDANPVLAKEEALAAWDVNPSVQARYAMLDAATTPGRAQFTTGGTVSALAFGPDGTTLATADTNGTAQRWDVATGKQIGSSLRVASPRDFGNPGTEAFNPDAGIVAGTGYDDTLRVWNFAARHLIGRSLIIHGNGAPVALSADGTIAANGTYDGKAQVWNVAAGQQIGSNFTVSSNGVPVTAVALSPDGRILAAINSDGVAQLWDANSGQPIGGPLDTSRAPGNEAAFSPNGEILAVGSFSHVLLFNVATRGQIGSPLASGWVQSLAFSQNGATLAAGCEDGTAMLWNVTTRQQIGSTLTGSNTSGAVHAVALSPDGKTLATGSEDGTIRLWDVGTEQPTTVPLPTSPSSAIVLSTDGKTWATENSNGTFQLGDVATRQLIGTPFTVGDSDANNTPLFNLDVNYLVIQTTSDIRNLQLWDVAAGHKIDLPILAAATAAAISSNSKILAAASGGTVSLWNLATHRQIGRSLAASTETVYSLAFSPDGKTLATGSTDDTARLWDLATHREIGSPLTTSNWVLSLAFSPDGKTLATGSVSDGIVRLWDVATDQQIGSTLNTGPGNGPGEVRSLAFSPDGKTLKTLTLFVQNGLVQDVLQQWDVQYLVNTAQYLCALLDNQSMTHSDWALNASGVPYQDTCR
jgi:WD40 repeat protein